MDLRGSLGRRLQHTLLRYEDNHQWPHVEKWELDWAVADPVGYQDRRVPTWLRDDLSLTEPLPDLDLRRGGTPAWGQGHGLGFSPRMVVSGLGNTGRPPSAAQCFNEPLTTSR